MGACGCYVWGECSVIVYVFVCVCVCARVLLSLCLCALVCMRMCFCVGRINFRQGGISSQSF